MVTKDGAFEFVEGGHSYQCRVEKPAGGRTDPWWWFEVKGDRSRYAPFRAEPGDTEDSVRRRISRYYEERLVTRGWADWKDKGDTPAPARA